MRYIFSILLSLMPFIMEAYNLDSLLNVLDRALERRDTYFMDHEQQIEIEKKSLTYHSLNNLEGIANTFHSIFELYKSFQGDSAAIYANKELEVAERTEDPELIARAQMDRIYSKITGGLFPEAIDIVKSTDLSQVSDSTKGDFYFLCNRLYTDMSNFADGTFSDENANKAKAYCDSVIKYLPTTAYKVKYASIFNTLEDKTTKQKIAIFDSIMNRTDIDNSEKAMISSIIGDLYVWEDDLTASAYYKAQSALLDLLSAKRETNSKLDLARLMFKFGDIDRANLYISMALEDAQFFHARHRMGEISSLLPIIEQARFINVNREKGSLITLSVLLVIVVVALAIVVFIVIKQKKRLNVSNEVIANRNQEVEKANQNLEKLNQDLKDANERIRENNRIKDEYIGYGFYANAEYINKLDNLYKLLKTKLRLHQYTDIENIIKEKDIKKEKEAMKLNFDKIFLKLFPSFVEDYKKLFPEGDETFEKGDKDDLTPEMRIFALIRLGIDDCSEIARFLNYSVHTVNTYKTKAKNRSVVPNEDFEGKIMSIQSVS